MNTCRYMAKALLPLPLAAGGQIYYFFKQHDTFKAKMLMTLSNHAGS